MDPPPDPTPAQASSAAAPPAPGPPSSAASSSRLPAPSDPSTPSTDPRLSDMDSAELLAVRALGDLMHSTSSVATSSSSSHPSTSEPVPSGSSSAHDPNFYSRVSSLPVVNPLLRAYSTATEGSRVVKYVEGTIGAVGGSLIGEERGRRLDEWGCRTLDRVGVGIPGDPSSTPSREEALGGASTSSGYTERLERDFDRDNERTFLSSSTSVRSTSGDRSASSSDEDQGGPESRGRSRRSNRRRDLPLNQAETSLLPLPERRSPPQSGNRWSNMLVEAGMTAGGIGAAVSEESMKSLKYCLQWLQYATAHIDHQIHLLRDFLQTLSSPTTPQNALISPASLHTLSRIKSDVVETIRKVVGVVSTYAGGALPEGAKNRVKGLVLALPERWAMANPGGGGGQEEEGPTISAAKAATGRVLSLAVEGLDMLSGCAAVFGESLERAEMWVERLRILGLQRAAAHSQAQQQQQQQSMTSPAPPHLLGSPTTGPSPHVLSLPSSLAPTPTFQQSTTSTTDDSGATTPTMESSFFSTGLSSSSRTTEDGSGIRVRKGRKWSESSPDSLGADGGEGVEGGGKRSRVGSLDGEEDVALVQGGLAGEVREELMKDA